MLVVVVVVGKKGKGGGSIRCGDIAYNGWWMRLFFMEGR